MTKKEKGKKWDGRSRLPNDQYKKNWNDIFGNRNVVRTEASFISRDYSDESPSDTSTTKRKPSTTRDRKES